MVKRFAQSSPETPWSGRKYLPRQALNRNQIWHSNCLQRGAPTSPETSLISERVFLAFDTGRGLAYVQASGWDRTYLLWTFRNFRGVPHKILNDRQRMLVETLYAAASTQFSRELHEDVVIGTVEDF